MASSYGCLHGKSLIPDYADVKSIAAFGDLCIANCNGKTSHVCDPIINSTV